MKIWRITGALAALLAVLTIAAIACSGGDDDDGDGGDSVSEITTQKGLTVANIDQFGGGTNAESADGDDASIGGPAPGAPAVDVGFGGDEATGRLGGGFAPDVAQQTGSGGGGLTVQGYGTATADADSARVEFYFGRYSEGEIRFDEPVPPDAGSGSSGSDGDDIDLPAELKPGAAEPITEDELQSVIDALNSAGADEVEFVEQSYYDPYWASATLRATVSNLDAIDGIVDAGNNAAANLADISLQSSNVMYTVSDCSALQQAALATAIEDAGDNAQTFAAALGVAAGEMIGASNLSWYPNDGSGCDSYWGYYPVEDIGFVGGPAEVSAYAQVAITYAMQ